MNKVSEKEIRLVLISILNKLTDVHKKQITGTDRLREDLELDSLQSMELLSRMGDEYGIELEVEEFMDVQTVDDVVRKVAKMVGV